MSALPFTRPEDRRRRPAEGPGWADTVPACFRSEGFAEDLLEPHAALPLVLTARKVAGRADPRQAIAAQSAR